MHPHTSGERGGAAGGVQDQPVADDVWQGHHGPGGCSAWEGAACALQGLGPHPLAQGIYRVLSPVMPTIGPLSHSIFCFLPSC